MVKTLQNLRRRGTILFASIVMRWREVEDYVSGEYFEHLEEYSRDILSVVALLKKAKYVLVCMPEAGPVEQLFEVRDIVRKSGGRVYGYVVNNIRGETHEKQSMIPLNVLHIPRVLIPRRNELHNRGDARATLFEIGKALHDGLLKKRALSRR